MRRAHDRDPLGYLGSRIHDHEREAVPGQGRELLAGLLGKDDDRAIGCAARQPLQQGHLPDAGMPGRAQDSPQVMLIQRLGGTGQDLGEAARMD